LVSLFLSGLPPVSILIEFFLTKKPSMGRALLGIYETRLMDKKYYLVHSSSIRLDFFVCQYGCALLFLRFFL
jgi:hypothetical protein